jgi:predicted nucleotidyltransferase
VSIVDLSQPISTVTASLDGPVLGVLAGTEKPLTGRKVHQLAGTGSESGVRKVLNRLVGTGLVSATEVGASIQYSLNRAHLAAGPVIELLDLRQGLIRRMQAAIEEWPVRPLHVSLFGPTARRDSDPDSDVDLLFIHEFTDPPPEWDDQLSSLGKQVRAWTGNHLQPHELSTTDLREHLEIGDPIINTWLRDGMTLAGPDLRTLLKTITTAH